MHSGCKTVNYKYKIFVMITCKFVNRVTVILKISGPMLKTIYIYTESIN